tara:strand:- start:2864 stop:3103 length:240 start_codon:yes stop_codon:yes gene_type:complete
MTKIIKRVIEWGSHPTKTKTIEYITESEHPVPDTRCVTDPNVNKYTFGLLKDSYVENEFDLDEHVKWRLDLNKLYNENR